MVDFDTQLRDFLDEQVALLAENGFDHGWMDGGCRMLADALVLWSESELQPAAVWEKSPLRGDFITHVVVCHGDTFIDGDGLADEDGILERLSKSTFRPLSLLRVGELSVEVLATQGEILQVPMVSEQLADRLLERFGPFSSAMIESSYQVSVVSWRVSFR